VVRLVRRSCPYLPHQNADCIPRSRAVPRNGKGANQTSVRRNRLLDRWRCRRRAATVSLHAQKIPSLIQQSSPPQPARVSEQLGSPNLCWRACRLTFGVSTPLFLPLRNDVPDAAIKRPIPLRRKAQTNTRQKQWSDIFNPYQQMERRAYAC
jgi:hypothetical protein